jgi:hypothetical protein
MPTVLEITSFTLLIICVSLLSLVIYLLWLVKRKLSKEGMFYEIFTLLLYCNVSIEAYALMFSIFSLFAVNLSKNTLFSMILYIPWIFFAFFIFKVARKIWKSIEEYGLT